MTSDLEDVEYFFSGLPERDEEPFYDDVPEPSTRDFASARGRQYSPGELVPVRTEADGKFLLAYLDLGHAARLPKQVVGQQLRRFSWLRVAAVAGKRVLFDRVVNRRLGRVFETDAGEVGVQLDDGTRGLLADESYAAVGEEVEVGLVDVAFDCQAPSLVFELCSIRKGARMQARVLGAKADRLIVDLYGETATLYSGDTALSIRSKNKLKTFVGGYLEVVVTCDDEQIEVAQVSSLDPTLDPSDRRLRRVRRSWRYRWPPPRHRHQDKMADDLHEWQTDGAWQKIESAYREGRTINGHVIDCVRGGFLVDVGLQVFLPRSLADIRLVDLESLKGQELQFKVKQIDRRHRNIVLSRKAVFEEELAQRKAETLSKIIEGAWLPGVVKNIVDYGVFVDLGGIDGLLHATDTSWGRSKHPSEHFSVGDEIEVVVLKFDPESERVQLGYKQRLMSPWSLAGERYRLGSRIEVKVVRLFIHGDAIVELEEGIQGRILSSEMSWHKGKRRRRQPVKTPKIGETVSVVVTGLDVHKRHISLSLCQAVPNPWKELSDSFPVGSIIEGRIRVLTRFSAYVEITEDINGRIPLNEHPATGLKKGDVVKARITKIDTFKQRVLLSVKEFLPSERTDSVTTKVVHGVEISFFPGETSCSILSFKLKMKQDQIEGALQRDSFGYIEFCRPLAYEEFEAVTDSLQSVDYDAGEDSWQSSVENIPWENLVAQYQIGDTVVGKVTYVTDFGLFINILKGPSGFADVSEIDLAVGNVANPESDWVSLKDHYHVGDWVKGETCSH